MGLTDRFKKKEGVSEVPSKNDDTVLNKFLPKTLFLGYQKEISEKALKGYILSIAKTAFENIGNVKYSIKKIKKDEYLYEIHDGSMDLSYISLVHKKMFIEDVEELILKTQGNNVKVVRKPNGKLDTSVLLEHNSRDEDAIVDKSAKGKMNPVVKEGIGLFVTGLVFLVSTSLLASVSFITKYTMMNEDYSFSYERDQSLSPMEFVKSLQFNDHSEYKYLKSIKYTTKGGWKEEYGIIEKEPIDLNAPNKQDLKSANSMKDEYIADDHLVEKMPEATSVVDVKPVVKMEEVTKIKPVVKMEEVTTNMKEVESIEIKAVNETENNDFEIIDMETLDTLDLSNLPENIVIEGDN